jgi:hypothetical protein
LGRSIVGFISSLCVSFAPDLLYDICEDKEIMVIKVKRTNYLLAFRIWLQGGQLMMWENICKMSREFDCLALATENKGVYFRLSHLTAQNNTSLFLAAKRNSRT